ncbi:MAG: hypothetical protein HQL21_07720 [Candidatus Omnitrophica bacterium]|nr:hypothetical protein [Candidatus Omnitrophota bacterium]
MAEEQKKESKKGFWASLFEKLDKAMVQKAECGSCCCGPKDKTDNKCC